MLTGALCGLAFGTHNLGLTLGVAVLVSEFWRRRLTPYLAGAGLAFATIAAVAIVALAGARTVAVYMAGGAAAALVIYFVSINTRLWGNRRK